MIFERSADFADLFRSIVFAGLDRFQHSLAQVGTHANAARRETIDSEVAQVHNSRLLTNAGDNNAGVDKIGELTEAGILGRVVPDDGMLDPGNEAVVDEGFHRLGLDIAFELDVEHGGLVGIITVSSGILCFFAAHPNLHRPAGR